MEVVGNFGGKVLSCCWFGGGASAGSCLVVDKDPGGVCVCVVDNPLLGITGFLQNTKELSIMYFNVFSWVPFRSKMVVVVGGSGGSTDDSAGGLGGRMPRRRR